MFALAAFVGVHPNEQKRHRGGGPERPTDGVKNRFLQNQCHQEQPEGGPHHTADQKEPRTRFVGTSSKAFLQITVDGDALNAIIDGKQAIRHHHIAYKIAQDHLQITQCGSADAAWNRDKSHAT